MRRSGEGVFFAPDFPCDDGVEFAAVVAAAREVEVSKTGDSIWVEQAGLVQACGGGVFLQDFTQGAAEPFVDGKAEAAFGAGEQFGREVAVEECAEGGFTLAEPGVADAVVVCEIENAFVEEGAADF